MADVKAISLLLVEDEGEFRAMCAEWMTRKGHNVSHSADRHDALHQCSTQHFEVADGGTLFIDEIGEMPLAFQPKLLRVLEDSSMTRVGSRQERRVDVRIVAATTRDLSFEIEEGNIREDIYYRQCADDRTAPAEGPRR